MIAIIANYFDSMFHTVKKEDVLKNLENTLSILNDEVVPALDGVISNAGKYDLLLNNNILKSVANTSGIKVKDNRDLLVKIKGLLVNITKSGGDLTKIVEEDLSDIITDKTGTVKDIAIIKVVSDIGSLAMFTLDLVYFVLTNNGTSDSNYPKIKFNNIRNGVPAYSASLKSYLGNFAAIVKDLPKVASVPAKVETSKISMLERLAGKSGKLINLPNTQGFVGNPIYSIRMWLVDREISKYESLKDKRKLLDLKLMELKVQESGDENPKLRKQIEYYEDKISKVEYQIAQVEGDEDE
jgi:hypothetical protein